MVVMISIDSYSYTSHNHKYEIHMDAKNFMKPAAAAVNQQQQQQSSTSPSASASSSSTWKLMSHQNNHQNQHQNGFAININKNNQHPTLKQQQQQLISLSRRSAVSNNKLTNGSSNVVGVPTILTKNNNNSSANLFNPNVVLLRDQSSSSLFSYRQQQEINNDRQTSEPAAAAAALSTKLLTPLNPVVNSSNEIAAASTVAARLSLAPLMSNSVRLLDEGLQWHDNLLEFLIDQNDFLVVGILGKERVGKSTLMSLLAGSSSINIGGKKSIFKQNTLEKVQLGHHTTNGVQAYITSERTILLDVQPLLSGSVLDKAISVEKKYSSSSSSVDTKFYENSIEIQSIELACFILAVCNVVIMTEDWFTDMNLFRVIQTAEMLIPNLASSGSDNDLSQIENRPHFIYVLNKCDQQLNKSDLKQMRSCVNSLIKETRLIRHDSINSNVSGSSSTMFNYCNSLKARFSRPAGGGSSSNNNNDHLNMFVIPKYATLNSVIDQTTTTTTKEDLVGRCFGGYSLPSFERSSAAFVREILSIRRSSTTVNNLTEKKWFAYASRMWELIRKSTAINEYHRLMT